MRSYVYWAGLDAEIAEIVKKCDNCLMTAKAPTKAVPVFGKSQRNHGVIFI